MPLQTYKKYIVDYRLKQFRTIPKNFGTIEFIPFDSDEGDNILMDMIRDGVAKIDLIKI